jgi:hypothetical protein
MFLGLACLMIGCTYDDSHRERLYGIEKRIFQLCNRQQCRRPVKLGYQWHSETFLVRHHYL